MWNPKLEIILIESLCETHAVTASNYTVIMLHAVHFLLWLEIILIESLCETHAVTASNYTVIMLHAVHFLLWPCMQLD